MNCIYHIDIHKNCDFCFLIIFYEFGNIDKPSVYEQINSILKENYQSKKKLRFMLTYFNTKHFKLKHFKQKSINERDLLFSNCCL